MLERVVRYKNDYKPDVYDHDVRLVIAGQFQSRETGTYGSF